MSVEYLVYEDDVIAVKLSAIDTASEKVFLFHLAIRYLIPKNYQNKENKTIEVTNMMGGETDWFILPYSFGIAIGKTLIEQKVSGLTGFDEGGFQRMVNWLIEMEEISDAMSY